MVNHMESYREDTHMSPMPSLQDIFSYDSNVQQTSERRGNEQIALITDYHVEDRKKSEEQLNFGIIRENGYGILTVFDNASSTTLILRELIENGTVRAKYTKDVQLVKGTGSGAGNYADVAEVVLNRTD